MNTRRSVSASYALSDSVWSATLSGPAERPPAFQLLHQGELPSAVYSVDQGVVKMVHVTPSGDEHIVDVRRAPVLIGGFFAVVGSPAVFDVVSVTSCSLRWCVADAFVAAVAGDIVKLEEVHRLHCADLVSLADRITGLSLKGVKDRLNHFLSRFLAPLEQHQRADDQPFNQAELASIINVTPEHLSRVMRMAKASLARAGMVRRSRPRV